MEPNKITIEVTYAKPEKQYLLIIQVNAGCTIEKAIKQSGILDVCKEIDLSQQSVGVFGQLKELADEVYAGDRIEIYRPLLIDPKDARRKRVLKN